MVRLLTVFPARSISRISLITLGLWAVVIDERYEMTISRLPLGSNWIPWT